MCRKFLSATPFILAVTLLVSVGSAEIVPIGSITTDNPPGSPPYNILSVTVGDYTAAADILATGTTTFGAIRGAGCPDRTNVKWKGDVVI